MRQVNPAALLEYHLAAERWERCRAAWFMQCGNAAESRRRTFAAQDHGQAAKNARINLRKPR